MIAATVKLEIIDMSISIKLIRGKIMEIKVHLRMKMGGKHFQMRSLKILKSWKRMKKELTRTMEMNMNKTSLKISSAMEISRTTFIKDNLKSKYMANTFKIMTNIKISSTKCLFPFKETISRNPRVNIIIRECNQVKIANSTLRKIRTCMEPSDHRATKKMILDPALNNLSSKTQI